MPDINMQHFGELQRNQYSIDVEIDASQVASLQQDFPMMLETPNSSNSVLNVVAINELGEQLPTEIEGIANDKNWVHLKDSVHSGWDFKMKVFYGGCVGKPAADSTYGSQAVWNNNYIAVWHMNNNPNGDVTDSIKDSTSNANHGTPSGSMTTADLIDSDYGKAINFDGFNDFLTFGDIDVHLGVTVDVLVSMNSLPSTERSFVSRGNVSSSDYFNFRIDGTGSSKTEAWFSNSQNMDVSASALSVDIYYPITYKADLSNMHTHLNTVHSSTANSVSPSHSSYNGYIGVWAAGANPIPAKIAMVKISTELFSENYITTTHNNLSNPTATGTNPFYKLISKEHNFAESLQSLGRAG